jgi:hypothetical protein
MAIQEVTTTKRKPLERYMALYYKYTYMYPKVNKDGKPAFKTNPVTGNPVYDVDGNPQPVMLVGEFRNIQSKMSKGYLSEDVFDPNTSDPQEIARGEALRELSKKPDISVYTEDVHDQKSNPAMYAEKVKRLETEARLAEAEVKASRVAELERRLAEADGKRRQ